MTHNNKQRQADRLREEKEEKHRKKEGNENNNEREKQKTAMTEPITYFHHGVFSNWCSFS